MHMYRPATRFLFLFFLIPSFAATAQINWNKDGNSYTTVEENAIVEFTLPAMTKTTLVTADQLAPLGLKAPSAEPAHSRGPRGAEAFHYQFSDDHQKVLLFTKPVHSYHNTFYSCWVFNRTTSQLTPIANSRPILNAKISPDGSSVAYVDDNNIYSEALPAQAADKAPAQTAANPPAQAAEKLTTDGTDKLLNGWFDYAYSEELYTIDGFRWSPDSKSIAYWQLNLARVGIFYMINNTDSIYPKIIPIPFSKVGEPIAEARIGVITLATKTTKWMNIAGDPATHYLPRMEYTPDGSRLIVQQLNRAQNNSILFTCDPASGNAKAIYNESDDAWIDIKAFWAHSSGAGWDWLENGKAFLWASEKDGWRHLYRITLDGQETLLTKGNYDVTSINGVDEKKGLLYFGASPTNATQRYLYKTSLTKPTDPTKVTPDGLPGTHNYSFSPNGHWGRT